MIGITVGQVFEVERHTDSFCIEYLILDEFLYNFSILFAIRITMTFRFYETGFVKLKIMSKFNCTKQHRESTEEWP